MTDWCNLFIAVGTGNNTGSNSCSDPGGEEYGGFEPVLKESCCSKDVGGFLCSHKIIFSLFCQRNADKKKHL